MTVKAALQSTIAGYPVEADTLERILIKRGLDGASTFDMAIATSQAFELSEADVLIHLLKAANISEGDLSISMTEKSNLLKLASSIYEKYGETVPGATPEPTVQQVNFW